MVDAREAAHEAANKFMSKSSRWRTKIFSKEEAAPKSPENKPSQTQIDDDVNAFLKPSTDKAQQQRDAAAAFLASANRPRIDVARAQRWPGAQEILKSAAAGSRSPGPGGMRTGTRKKGLTVSFVRAVPEIIGHGGDECEEPAVEVSKRKQSVHRSNLSTSQLKPQDDANLGTGIGRTPSQTEQRNSLTRTNTSHGELSPPLGKKLEMGHINTHAQAPPPLPQRMGQMGLGERPRALARAPTGFDTIPPPGADARRLSQDSDYSQDSDNMSPVLARKISNVEPTIQEEDENFRPKPMSRTQTGFHAYEDAANNAPVPAIPAVPRLPEMRLVTQEDESPLDDRAMIAERFLQSELTQPDTFSARAKQRMRAEEGRALHEAAQRQVSKRDSDSSMQSLDHLPVGSPPGAVSGAEGYASWHIPIGDRRKAIFFKLFAVHYAFCCLVCAHISRCEIGTVFRLNSYLSRSDTRTLGEAAYSDFAERVTHMRGIFALTAQLGGQLYDRTPLQWLRAATWWFLRGRTGMEAVIRNRPRSGEAQPERLTQAHVDLAKVLWILTEVLPSHPGLRQYGGRTIEAQGDLARQAGDGPSAEAYEIQAAIVHYLKLLVGSMKKHQSMPPTQALIQGQDQSMTTVVSILRPKGQYQVKLAICSQSELINIILGPGLDGGPSWDDVKWKKQSNQISVHLRHGFTLALELSENDWRTLFSIVDHTNRVQTDLRERRDERFACKLQLREASYKDPANPGAFPQERVPGCKLIVFEKIELSSEGTGKRKLHRGYRMAMATSPQNKQVSLINHELGTKQAPMNFEYVTEQDQAPAMRLHFREESPDKKPRICTVHLVFQEGKDRNQLFGTFTSMNIAPGEMAFAQVPLKSFHIESADQAEGFSQKGSRVLEKLQWQEAKVVNQDPEAAGLESAPTVMSESLRIVCRHSAGIIADRMNLGPGELLVRLPIDGASELTLLRNAQQDLAVAIDSSRTERDVPDNLAELLHTLTTASTIRKLTFNSFKDLHAFQFAVTGFDVKFDGIASTFSISRRRMVVPIYKQWTANTIRIQIVEQDNIVQLLAFFEEFSHADAMNFKLSSMDTFEKSDKGGKFGLKLVDAKFALPVEERRGEGKMQKEEGRLTGWAGIKRKFVCLDEIEYPGEHDDILIQFDSKETRDVFASALPAATMERKFTVRRKI
ncbi:hypothetical protein EK21DRAFT_59863 [Setomelanomma holmii]|uniref:Uncharacterized protein n=1 Tax=Setomelanomma holmii TaxID=210430 RepID=A0A9P4LQK2_9PLEO|nr:hypothetical protein EK21DRAFT_59863 [Setomelanomma holmii]